MTGGGEEPGKVTGASSNYGVLPSPVNMYLSRIHNQKAKFSLSNRFVYTGEKITCHRIHLPEIHISVTGSNDDQATLNNLIL